MRLSWPYWPQAQPKVENVAQAVNEVDWNGHKVVFDSVAVNKTSGIQYRKVLSFDGEAIKDDYRNERRVEINGTLPCSAVGCNTVREGNNRFCTHHKTMQKDAYKNWKATHGK